MRIANGQSLDAADTSGVERRRATARRQGDIADILAILQTRWRTVLLVWIAVLGLAVAYLATAKRIYTGSASILIDARARVPVGDPAAAMLNSSPDAILVESQVRLISSDSVLRRVAEAEHLVDNPEFAPPQPGLRARLMALVGFGGKANAAPEDPLERVTAMLTGRVSVKRSERTYIADIEARAYDPALAARLATAVANAYFADQQAARVESAVRDSDWVLAQVTEMQTALQAAETKAETYRSQHGIIDVNGKMLNEQNLSEAATALVQARARVAEVRARYDQIERVIASGRSADTLPDALKSPAIDKLRSQYADISRQQATLRQTLGSRHPALLESDQQLRDVQRLIREELKRIEAGVANEYQTAQAGVTALETEVQSLKTTTVSSNTDRLKLDELQRDVDARRAVYDRFLRARDTVKEQASDVPIGRLIAPASVPTAPSSPKTVAVLALAGILGLLLGAGTALLAHTLRGTRSSIVPRRAPQPAVAEPAPLQVRAIPLIGTVPSPFGADAVAEARPRLVEHLRTLWPTAGPGPARDPDPAFTDAIAALPIAFEDDAAVLGFTTLVVTAPAGTEARTALALGVATRAVQLGLRPIVIDADGGRTLLRDLIEPGAGADLLDLMGKTRVCYWSPTGEEDPIGLVPKLADEALVVERLRGRAGLRHLDGLRGHFDVLIFDGPSLAEPGRLRDVAASAGELLLVLPPGATAETVTAELGPADLPDTLRITAVVAAPVLVSADTSAAA